MLNLNDDRIHLGSLPVSYFSINLIRKPPLPAVTKAVQAIV